MSAAAVLVVLVILLLVGGGGGAVYWYKTKQSEEGLIQADVSPANVDAQKTGGANTTIETALSTSSTTTPQITGEPIPVANTPMPVVPTYRASEAPPSVDQPPRNVDITTIATITATPVSVPLAPVTLDPPVQVATVASSVDSYRFAAGKDSGGGDIRREWPASVASLKATCSHEATCMGFNTNGYLKRSIQPEAKWDTLGIWNTLWDASTPVAERGLYIKT